MYFSRDIACAALLFHRREKQKPSIYKHVRMYTSLSTFCIFKKEKRKTSIGGYRRAVFRSAAVSCLDILRKCYFLIL